MSRTKNIAILLVVAIGAFYGGSLAEFQFGAFAPDWTKSLLLYTPPKSNVDYRTLDDVFTTIQQHYVKPDASGVKLTEGAAAGVRTVVYVNRSLSILVMLAVATLNAMSDAPVTVTGSEVLYP